MSVKVMALVWDAYRPNVDQKLALLAIADWSDDDGKCFFSETELASRVRIDTKAMRSVLEALRADGTLSPLPKHPGWHRLALDRLSVPRRKR